ncbi:MAG: pyruvate formate lyase-activating protein [Victivallales bacterium]|jgi:pyruvate formate lyase activating enzyme|nr:pyruvate formate lyase-activating protein [Victivallales bacterium]
MNREISGRIHSIESFGTLDGPGVRFVVFLQGCPLRCRYCHNPDTWSVSGGKEITVTELMRQIESCRNFISSGGVTLSGGEVLMQKEFTVELLQRCREQGFHTALDTAGSLPIEFSRAMIDAADLLLLDIKSLDSELCQKLTGQDNTNTLSTLNYCEKIGKAVWIRHVLIPGWTLEVSKLKSLATYLADFKCVQRVDLLPFHRMAEFKWKALKCQDFLMDTPEPTPDELEIAERIFR